MASQSSRRGKTRTALPGVAYTEVGKISALLNAPKLSGARLPKFRRQALARADHFSFGCRNLECTGDSIVQRCENCALCFGQLREMAVGRLFRCLNPGRQV